MNTEKLEKAQTKLEWITRKWWFYLLLVLLQFVPPYAAKGISMADIGWITGEVLSHGIVYNLTVLYPIFKVIPIALIILIIFLKNRATLLFSIYAGISYVLFAFLQNIAVTEKYGLAIITINLIMFLLVAAFWFWESVVRKNVLIMEKQPLWKYWVVPIAFIAFWYPANPNTLLPDFNPIYFFTNMAGLAFCLMTPVYLAVLTLYHPKVNIVTLRVTSLVGIIIALYNMWVNFLIAPAQLWWNGVLHIPLLSISIYAFALSFRKSWSVE